MARPTKEERLQGVHGRALAEFDRIQASLRDERKQCLEDRRFYSIAGAQWEGPLGQQFENKPKFEVNKVHLSVIRIINEYRNNRITVDFVSKDGADDDTLADTCDGLYRADEEDSGAEESYDNAFEEAVGGGFGAWRLRTKYEDEEDPENEQQRIVFEPIYDADSSVFFDLDAKKQDKSDAKRGFVVTAKAKQDYIDEYGDDPASWPKTVTKRQFDWSTPDVVYVAEYYEIEERTETTHVYRMLDGSEDRFSDDDLEEETNTGEDGQTEDGGPVRTRRDELAKLGAREVRTKKVKRKKVHKYLLSGSGILEDMGYIAGSCIPIIPVYGKRWYVDNVERCMGHVRLAKDAQRLKNMQLSKLGEISAVSSVSKPIVSPEQIAGHQTMWEEDNIRNFAYLLLNPVTDKDGNENVVGPMAYTKSPEIPPSLAALLQLTEEDMKDLLGNQQAGEEIQGNVSTETAHLIQNRVDMQTFIYLSNMAKAVKRCGEVWLSMARDVLVEEGRTMKARGASGELSRVQLMKPVVDDRGAIVHQNDMGKARFDVSVEVGPSSSTRRAATVRSLTSMAAMTDDPETKQVLGAMAMMNMEGEGIGDVRRYFRWKLIKMGVVEPNEQEAVELKQEQDSTPPSAQDQYLEAAAGAEQARGAKAQADTIKSQADADRARAETLQILQGLDNDTARVAIEAIEKLGPRVTPPSIEGSSVQQ